MEELKIMKGTRDCILLGLYHNSCDTACKKLDMQGVLKAPNGLPTSFDHSCGHTAFANDALRSGTLLVCNQQDIVIYLIGLLAQKDEIEVLAAGEECERD